VTTLGGMWRGGQLPTVKEERKISYENSIPRTEPAGPYSHQKDKEINRGVQKSDAQESRKHFEAGGNGIAASRLKTSLGRVSLQYQQGG